MEQQERKPFYKKSSFGVALLIIFLVFIMLGISGSSPQSIQQKSNNTMDDIYAKVASDAVDQYHIAERQGDKIQICVQAGMVSAAYLQAKNESSYRNWKEIEKIDCRQAGIPK